MGRKRRRRLSGVHVGAEPSSASPTRQGSVPAQFADLGQNDDAKELRMRRRSMARRKSTPRRSSSRSRAGVNSPYVVSARRGSVLRGVRGDVLTTGQLADIYSKCIQLAQHGKITQQNTWDLKLVDYITDVLQIDEEAKTGQDGAPAETNFQKASHTIDAASKIYGSRVDSVHKDTFKVLTSFNQTEGGEVDDAMIEETKRQRRTRNRNVGRNTLVTKEDAVCEALKNLSAHVDPLFHKTASTFDEGGAKGLLMNQLHIQNGCEIVFDSDTLLQELPEEREGSEDRKEVNEEEWLHAMAELVFPGEHDATAQVVESAVVCPFLAHFEKSITEVSKGMPAEALQRTMLETETETSRDQERLEFDTDRLYDSDDDVVMGMDMATARGMDHEEAFEQIDVNAAQLFDDNFEDNFELPAEGPVQFTEVQQVSGSGALHAMAASGSGPVGVVDGAANYAAIAGENAPTVTIQPKNAEMQFAIDKRAALASMAHQRPTLGKAINLSAMNQLIEELENADMETMTTFFDPKKHGNWAGPDQWYHRRYQLMVQRQRHVERKALPAMGSRRPGVKREAADNEEYTPSGGKRRRRAPKGVDFLSIAKGDFVDDACFARPARSNMTLTSAILARNEKNTHRLPKDLQIRPNIFIKMFTKPSYSVWNHWLKTYQARAKVAADPQSRELLSQISDVVAHDTDPVHQIERIQAAYNAALGDEDEDLQPDFYDYSNRNDSDNFVPEMFPVGGDPREDGDDADADAADAAGDFSQWHGGGDFELIDAPDAVRKIDVHFATKAKKVDVRNLKQRIWDHLSRPAAVDAKENLDPNADGVEEMEAMEDEAPVAQRDAKRSFQAAVSSLTDTIESKHLPNVSIPFCFICLLHLANEKNLLLEQSEGFGDFPVWLESEREAIEAREEQPEPIMILN